MTYHLPPLTIAANIIPHPDLDKTHQQPTFHQLTTSLRTALLRSHPNDDMLLLPKTDCQMLAQICHRICEGFNLTDTDGNVWEAVFREVDQ